jgi:type IX secretion system PorP/SprF family membrane protein
MKKILLTSFLLLQSSFLLMAQQAPLVSHYMFNSLLINPAYAGSKEYVSATLLYRKQWAGLEGAPVTYSGSVHGLFKKQKLGLGAFIQQDKIGVTKQTDAYASAAYHLSVGDVGKLSVGLQMGVTSFSSDVVQLTYWDPGDKVFDYNSFTSLLPNAGLGVYYYRPLFYAGLSAPYLLSYDANQSGSVSSSKPVHHQDRRFYATVGGVIESEYDVKFKPSVLVRSEGNTPLQFDLNMNVLINDIFWIGASYRSNDAIVALLEYQVNRKFRIGYSYDYTLSEIGNYNSGSHEVMLGYDFGYPVVKMKSPRYF